MRRPERSVQGENRSSNRLIEAPRSKLWGIFDRVEVSHFQMRSLTPQPRQNGISVSLRQAAGNALAFAVQTFCQTIKTEARKA